MRARGKIVLAALVALVLVPWIAVLQRTPLTGDEPRYLYYAHSFFLRGDFHLAEPAWRKLVAMQPTPGATHLATGDARMIVAEPGVGPSHAVGMPVLLSPVVGAFPSLAADRLAIMALAAATLILLFRLLAGSGIDARSSILALALAGVSIPFLSYSGVFYAEIPLAFLIAAGWCALHRPLDKWTITAVVACVLLLPFIHLRGAASAIGLAIFLAHRIWRDTDGTRRVHLLVATGLAWLGGGALFIAVNIALFGGVLGSVTSANSSVSLGTLRELLFNHRHGVLLYSPIIAFGVLGLARAAGSRSRLGIEGLVLLLLSVLASLGPSADESPPARFLVQAVPALAVGLALFLDRRPGFSMGLAFLLALGWTSAVSVDYVQRPGRYIENREACNTCLDVARHLGWGGGHGEYRLLSPTSRLVELTIAKRERGEVRSIEIRPIEMLPGAWTTRPGSGMAGIVIVRSTRDLLVLRLTDNGILARCAPVSVFITDTRGRELDIRPVTCSEQRSVQATYRMVPAPAVPMDGVEGFGGLPGIPLGEIAIAFPEPIHISAIDASADGGNGGTWTTRPRALWGIEIHDAGDRTTLRNPGPRTEDLDLDLPATVILRLPDNGSLAGCARLSLHVTLTAGNSTDIPVQCAEQDPK